MSLLRLGAAVDQVAIDMLDFARTLPAHDGQPGGTLVGHRLEERGPGRGDALPEAPLLSIDAPVGASFAVPPDASTLVSLGDSEVPWQETEETPAPAPDSPEPRPTEQHEAGVE